MSPHVLGPNYSSETARVGMLILGDVDPDLVALAPSRTILSVDALRGLATAERRARSPELASLLDGIALIERERTVEGAIDLTVALCPKAALGALRSLTSPQAAPEPAQEKRLVRIAATDYGSAVVLAPWIARLRTEAKGIVVHVESIGAASIEPLAYGELDLALAPRIPVAGLDQFVFRHLVEDRLVCAVRSGHPSAKNRLTLERYLALDHVMVGIAVPAVSAVQAALHRIGRSRRVVARVPSFSTALDIAAASDLAVSVPERMLAPRRGGFVARPLPFAVEPITLGLVFHPRRARDPFHRWVREGIERAAKG